MTCSECGAEVREGARFCPVCGTAVPVTVNAGVEPETRASESAAAKADGPPPASSESSSAANRDRPAVEGGFANGSEPKRDAPPEPRGADAQGSAGSALSQAIAQIETFSGGVLPGLPFRLFWNPRLPFRVTTSTSDRRVVEIFEASVIAKPHVLTRANNYFRTVSWAVQRNAIGGGAIATCHASRPVTIGFGNSKVYLNVNGDTIDCLIDRPKPDARGEITVGVGNFTSWLGFYIYPATKYPIGAVRALKREDPSAEIRYPWSIFRMVTVGLVALLVLIALSSGGGGSSSAAVSAPPSASAETPADPGDSTVSQTATEQAESAPSAAPQDQLATDFPSGRYVRLGSFRSKDRAQREAARVADAGVENARVLDSDRTVGLLPAFFVVAAGPMSDSAEERQTVHTAKKAGIGGTLTSSLRPASQSVEASAFADQAYSGPVSQVAPASERATRRRDVRIAFDDDGEGASVTYGHPSCASSLTFEGSAGVAVRYRESVTDGPCSEGGTWTFKTENGHLLGTWWRTGSKTFRVGTLDAE